MNHRVKDHNTFNHKTTTTAAGICEMQRVLTFYATSWHSSLITNLNQSILCTTMTKSPQKTKQQQPAAESVRLLVEK